MEDSLQDRSTNDVQASSSFEVIDYDPVISELATQLFMRTSEYLHEGVTNIQTHYSLLEEINRRGISKFTVLHNFVRNLFKAVYQHEEVCVQQIMPLLEEIDRIDTQVNFVEQKAYQLYAYTKHLHSLHKDVLDK